MKFLTLHNRQLNYDCSLDSLLDGGILCGEIIEFYGASASGKTQVSTFV